MSLLGSKIVHQSNNNNLYSPVGLWSESDDQHNSLKIFTILETLDLRQCNKDYYAAFECCADGGLIEN